MNEIASENTILIVDDDRTILKVLRTILQRQDFNVLEAQDGGAALEIIKSHDVSMVITDVFMPNVTGIDLLTEIRKFSDSIPVVVITGKASVDAAVECMKIGAIDYISKPFSLAKIEETVQATLAQIKPPPPADDETTRIRNHKSMISGYNIVDRVGEGNMGIVYLVEKFGDKSGNRYALKIYKSSSFDDTEYAVLRKRFIHEAEAASRVKHENIVEFIEYGLDNDDLANFIVTEYINGKSLKHYINHPESLDYGQKARMIDQMAGALAAIHKVDICHRDLKPANVMIDEELNVKITDFGIAKLPDSMLTQKNDLMGSPSYMAPESFITSRIDHRADIFSLGILSYELILGTHPFQAENFLRLCYLIRNEDPPEPKVADPSCPELLSDIVMKMLKKAPRHRYRTADSIRKDLGPLLTRAID